jgi:hypothetical protein
MGPTDRRWESIFMERRFTGGIPARPGAKTQFPDPQTTVFYDNPVCPKRPYFRPNAAGCECP